MIARHDFPGVFFMRIAIATLLTVVCLSGAFLAREAAQANTTVRHVVVFRYKAGTTEAQIRRVTEAFRALKDSIPGVVSFEHGVNNSPEKLNQGFTHVYLLTFANAAARDAYLPHPEHRKFGEMLAPLLEQPFVVDYHPLP
jgi:hypothetical protein